MEKTLPAQNSSLWAYLQLLRPANVVTALADIAAGYTAAAAVAVSVSMGLEASPVYLAWLLLATIGLYGGGVVFNDVFDAELDEKERPERPIPSGRASKRGAATLGAALLLLGVTAASMVSYRSGYLALSVAACAMIYDVWAKHHSLAGPVAMGLCRGGNLLLGVSAVPAMVDQLWFLAVLPVLYIASVTAVSRGEVHGGTSRTGLLALGLVAAVVAGVLMLGPGLEAFQVVHAAPFLLLFVLAVVPSFVRAAHDPRPDLVRKAVKSGVLALIILDATLAAGFGDWPQGLIVLALLPVSIGLARLFAVT